MLVRHIAVCAQVIVIAACTLPAHPCNAMFLTSITDNIGVLYTWKHKNFNSKQDIYCAVAAIKKSRCGVNSSINNTTITLSVNESV